jgi:hypothetical protein
MCPLRFLSRIGWIKSLAIPVIVWIVASVAGRVLPTVARAGV